MNIKIYYKNKSKPILTPGEIKSLLDISISKLGLTNDSEVEIIFTDKSEIRKLNSKHRKINKKTDVLSFPQTSFNAKINILGSIVICDQVVQEKNEDLSDVIKHGFIHLLGYDHEIDQKTWDETTQKIDCNL